MSHTLRFVIEMESDKLIDNIDNLKWLIAYAIRSEQCCAQSPWTDPNDPLYKANLFVTRMSDLISDDVIHRAAIVTKPIQTTYQDFSIYDRPDLITQIVKLGLTESQRSSVYGRVEHNRERFEDIVHEITEVVAYVRAKGANLTKRQITNVLNRVVAWCSNDDYEELLNRYLSENKTPVGA